MMISNDTGKAFAKIVNQFLLQTLRVLKKNEKCLSGRTADIH